MLSTRANPPLSPVSTTGTIWPNSGSGMDDNNNNNINNGAYPNAARGQLMSPPNSGGQIGPMNGGFPPGSRSSAGGPSPPPSVGRSSTATNLYARSESGSIKEADVEAILAEHYVSLKRYLSQTSRDGKPTVPANKARDKLKRLTGVQFLELSTDVFDELLRRQSFSRRPPNAPPQAGPPPFLLPEDNFHPKRNQARQKLSSLGAPRFRDLATDVFCELERRYPRFVVGDIPREAGSPTSTRAPSRSGTPMGGYPPRGPGRRQPSNASSFRTDAYDIPPSPGMQPNNYDRPMPKQFQSNTIIPNKSTMVEEDDDAPNDEDEQGMYALNGARDSKKSIAASENDKRLIEDYEIQLRELREKLDSMEDSMKKKDDEMNNLLDGERSRSTATNAEKQEWTEIRNGLEKKLTEARNLNDGLREDLDRLRDDHANEMRRVREEMEDIRVSATNIAPQVSNDPEIQKENDELRTALNNQRQITDQVRREAQEFLREMKMLSQQSGSSWEKQAELEKTIETLEDEVREWRNRYAKTKTQLRDMRASSMGLAIDQDAGKYIREKGFMEETGLVKDVHVTKFQIAIDELLRCARVDVPDKVIDSMKAVVVSVRRITKDIDVSAPNNDQATQQRKALKGRVSSTANNLITASKNFAAAAGMSPVSILDAAASHLVAALVELLRTVKIRATPAGELEDDDDGTITPVDSTGFFSPRTAKSASIQSGYQQDLQLQPLPSAQQDVLPRPPPFQGLGNRGSVDSSAYSPVNSPRETGEPYSQTNGNGNGASYLGMNSVVSNGFSGMRQADPRTEDLKVYLDDQTAVLVQTIQNLVGSIRSSADINKIAPQIDTIVDIVGQIISETEADGHGGDMGRLVDCRQRLMEAGVRGQDLAADGKVDGDREWRMWTQTLPPIAFEIARETKELVQRIDRLINGGGDDFL